MYSRQVRVACYITINNPKRLQGRVCERLMLDFKLGNQNRLGLPSKDG